MRFAFNEDQLMFAGVLDQILGAEAAGFRAAEGWGRFEYGADLDAQLEESGFFNVAGEDTLGVLMAAEMVARIAAQPVVVEAAASALLRPLLDPSLPRPIAVIDGPLEQACRFAPIARSLVWLKRDETLIAEVAPGKIAALDSLFAYPMGECDAGDTSWRRVDADPAKLRLLWRIGIAAELAGALKGGLEAVLAHVRDRNQFGRPLGSFQGVQHRLAGASVGIEAAHLLTLKAAASGDAGDVALALAHAQRIAKGIVYDLHQFMGAMGLTLEHPLHRFTYRIRHLAASCGGSSGGLAEYADLRWGSA